MCGAGRAAPRSERPGRDGSRARPSSCWPRWRRRRTSHSRSCRRCSKRPVAPARWRFFDRHGISFKKKPRTPPSRSALTSPRAAGPGSRANPISIPAGWCSSTRPGPRPKWPACVAARSVANVACRGPTWTLEDNHLRPPVYAWMATAPMLLDGPMNGVAFLAYVEQVLVPTLVPGDQVIMDNLRRPQGRRCQTSNRGGRRDTPAPAALLTRLQSHRTSLLKTQGIAQKGRRPHRR